MTVKLEKDETDTGDSCSSFFNAGECQARGGAVQGKFIISVLGISIDETGDGIAVGGTCGCNDGG